jgi:lambda repressor-like predicted transcriptional regulator
MSPSLLHPITREVSRARKHMLDTGWSYRTAAAQLGCSFTQLSHVLTGRRKSQSLVARILSLKPR